MAVPSVSCTYSWPVWTEELVGGITSSPPWLGLILQFAVCLRSMSLSRASTLALMAILEVLLPATLTTFTVVDSTSCQQQLQSTTALASQGGSSLGAATVTYQADLLNL